MNFFTKRKRGELIQQRREETQRIATENEERKASIAKLEADPDLLSYRHALDLEKQISRLKNEQWDANQAASLRLTGLDNEIARTADKKIEEFVSWAIAERVRLSKAVEVRGSLIPSRFGAPTGKLISNAQKIHSHIALLDEAIKKVKALAVLPEADLGPQIKKIRDEIPLPDTSLEEVDADPAIAFTVS